MGPVQLVVGFPLLTFEVLFCILSQFKDILLNLQCFNLFFCNHIPIHFGQKWAIYPIFSPKKAFTARPLDAFLGKEGLWKCFF